MVFPETISPGVDTAFSTKLNANFSVLSSISGSTSTAQLKLQGGYPIGKLTVSSTTAATSSWANGDLIFQW